MLPKLTNLSKIVKLPVLKKDVKISAFTVSEYKNLLLNKNQSSDELETFILEVLKNKSPDIDVEELTMTDIVVLYLNMVDISNGLEQDIEYRCSKIQNDGKECDTTFTYHLDLSKYQIEGKSQNNTLIKINDDISIEMKYPSYLDTKRDMEEDDYIINLICSSIVAVYDKEEPITDFTEDEIYEWVKELPSTFLLEYNKFLSTVPTISISYTVECPKCHNKIEFKSNNLLDFFTNSSEG